MASVYIRPIQRRHAKTQSDMRRATRKVARKKGRALQRARQRALQRENNGERRDV